MALSVFKNWPLENRMFFDGLIKTYLTEKYGNILSGPLRGKDGAIDFMYLHEQSEVTVYHCTIQKTGLQKKYEGEIIDSTNCINSLVAFNDLVVNHVFFGLHSVSNNVAKVHDMKQSLVQLLNTQFKREGKIEIIDGENLFNMLWETNGSFPKTFASIKSVICKILFDGNEEDEEIEFSEKPLLEDDVKYQRAKTELFENVKRCVVDKYQAENSILPFIYKELSYCIKVDPLFAYDVLELAKKDYTSLLYKLICPLCKISIYYEIENADLESYLSSHEHIRNIANKDFLMQYFYRLSNIYKHLVYVGKFSVILKNLDTLHMTTKDINYWKVVNVDLFFRAKNGNISPSPEIYAYLESLAKEYLLTSNSIMQRLCLIFEAPLQYIKGKTNKQIVNELVDITCQGENFLECNWGVKCFQLIYPLLESTEEEADYYKGLLAVIKAIKVDIMIQYPALNFALLYAYLKTFIATSSLEYIRMYERLFIDVRKYLGDDQIGYLQIEYSSCLLLILSRRNAFNLDEITFSQLLLGGSERILSHPLFANKKTTVLKFSDAISDKEINLLRLVERYCEATFRSYALNRLKIDYTNALQFSIFPIYYKNRNVFVATITNSYQKTQDYTDSSYCCKAIKALQYIHIDLYKDKIIAIAQKALESDRLAVVRACSSIMKSLNSLYYYTASDKDEIRKLGAYLIDNMAEINSISAKLYVGYFISIEFTRMPLEEEFLQSLFDARGTNNISSNFKFNNSDNIEIPAKWFEIINSYLEKGSYLAKVVIENVVNPETWNLLGTITFNNIKVPMDLKKASLFYSISIGFGQALIGSPKYRFNYIRAMSKYYQKVGLIENRGFLKHEAYFIASSFASNFHYRVECCEPYFDLLRRFLKYENEASHIKEVLYKRKWIIEALKNYII